jgi:hypothetical protein
VGGEVSTVFDLFCAINEHQIEKLVTILQRLSVVLAWMPCRFGCEMAKGSGQNPKTNRG